MSKPTIEECIQWLDRSGVGHNPLREATIAHLRQAEIDAAKLADARVARVPRHAPSFSMSEVWPYVTDDDEGLALVAAWDAEWEQSSSRPHAPML